MDESKVGLARRILADGPGDENRHSPKAKQKSARYALHPFSALLLLLS